MQVNLEASQQGEVKKGDRAQIALPGNTSVTGKVDRLGKVARTAGKDDHAGDATIPAYISLDEPKKARGLDRAPVQVEITTKGVESALSVPVYAAYRGIASGMSGEWISIEKATLQPRVRCERGVLFCGARGHTTAAAFARTSTTALGR